MGGLKVWLRALRAPFFTASLVPVIVGCAVSWWQRGVFDLGLFILTMLGMVFLHAGCNIANDYFDHLSGNDAANLEFNPFSGGSRVIQEGLISPRAMLAASLLFFALGSLIGLYLAWLRGWEILLLGAAGVFFAFFYTAPVVFLAATGLGELAVALGFGVLPVLGAYFVQVKAFSWEALLASLPVAALIAGVLYINEFPDLAADRKVGKKTLVVRLGKERALWGYLGILVFAYLSLLLAVVSGKLPYPVLLAFLTLPLAVKAFLNAHRHYGETPKLLASNALTILIHLAYCLLLSLGFLLS